jgi:hypothetical protein
MMDDSEASRSDLQHGEHWYCPKRHLHFVHGDEYVQ